MQIFTMEKEYMLFESIGCAAWTFQNLEGG